MNRDMAKGVAIGVGVGLLAPLVFPTLGRVMRPMMDTAVRAGVTAWERGRESLAELGEYAEDMAAEVRLRRMAGEPQPPAAEEEEETRA